jgi:hypothetical protein
MQSGSMNSHEWCKSYNTAKLHGTNQKNKAEKMIFVIDSNCIRGDERTDAAEWVKIIL